ncbi:MAG: hypothetical protein OEV78_02715 [Spirochaetia bacterium]|nr:hypothetical protein [Spirochaetia bacterium]
MAADEKADAMYKSASKEVAAFITNKTGKDYMGEDYERVLLNMIIGINYMMLNNFESAKVEFKKVNNKLEYIKDKSGKQFQLNLMALYLSAISHAASDEYEYAYVDLKRIHQIQPGIPAVGLKLLALSAELGYDDDYAKWKKLYNLQMNPGQMKNDKNSTELVVIYEAGLSPRKISRGRLLDDQELNAMFRAAVVTAIVTSGSSARAVSNQLVLSTVATAEHPVPKYIKQNYEIVSARLNLMSQGKLYTSVELRQMNDVEDTVLTNFENHYQKIKQEMITRLATKVVATLVSKAVAEQVARQAGGRSYGGLASLLVGTVAGVGMGAALFSSEKPDLRCWHSIPASYHAGSVSLPPGKYDGIITYFNRNGSKAYDESIGEVTVLKDKPQILLFRTYK